MRATSFGLSASSARVPGRSDGWPSITMSGSRLPIGELRPRMRSAKLPFCRITWTPGARASISSSMLVYACLLWSMASEASDDVDVACGLGWLVVVDLLAAHAATAAMLRVASALLARADGVPVMLSPTMQIGPARRRYEHWCGIRSTERTEGGQGGSGRPVRRRAPDHAHALLLPGPIPSLRMPHE